MRVNTPRPWRVTTASRSAAPMLKLLNNDEVNGENGWRLYAGF